ncbi:MAG: hypothetical protein ABIQ73_02735 [Acidimicrobiales bacterium]
MARNGLAGATAQDPTRHRPGLTNLRTYGRHVTLTLQSMANTDATFAPWWAPYEAKFSRDPLMKYFNDASNATPNDGTATAKSRPSPDTKMIAILNMQAPPNTVGTFFGEQRSSNGWEVQMPDGSIERIYFHLPEPLGLPSLLNLENLPTSHDGVPITDTSIANIGGIYITTLVGVVEAFAQRFAQET